MERRLSRLSGKSVSLGASWGWEWCRCRVVDWKTWPMCASEGRELYGPSLWPSSFKCFSWLGTGVHGCHESAVEQDFTSWGFLCTLEELNCQSREDNCQKCSFLFFPKILFLRENKKEATSWCDIMRYNVARWYNLVFILDLIIRIACYYSHKLKWNEKLLTSEQYKVNKKCRYTWT